MKVSTLACGRYKSTCLFLLKCEEYRDLRSQNFFNLYAG